MIRNKAQVQEYLLGRLKKSSSDIIESAVISNEGLVLVSTAVEADYRDRMSAFAASIFKPSKKAATDLLLNGINFILVSGNKRTIYIREITGKLLLAVIVKQGADWEKLQNSINTAAEDLKHIAGMTDKFVDNEYGGTDH